MKNFIMAGICLILCYPVSVRCQIARPDAHAPIGVMGDHVHGKGEIMFSYRVMFMTMKGNLLGSDGISSEEIVTSIPNRFSGMAGQPPTLRVVPQKMNMVMHMFGAMYAPGEHLTLMASVPLVTRSMDLTTYQGGAGTDVLGDFTTRTTGLGDIKLTGLFKLSDRFHLNLGLSIPNASIEKQDEVLTPMNMRPTMRLPYAMQCGSGTWDLLPGATFKKTSDNVVIGAQVSGIIRLGENSAGYTLGNHFLTTAWTSYRLNAWLSVSGRLSFDHTRPISNMDPGIVAPVQTADPDLYGGSSLEGHLGINTIGQTAIIRNQRLALEIGTPLWQKLNGPQMKTNSLVTLGWQYAF